VIRRKKSKEGECKVRNQTKGDFTECVQLQKGIRKNRKVITMSNKEIAKGMLRLE